MGLRSAWIKAIGLLLICSFSSFVSCATPPAKTVEVAASVNCKQDCIAVTKQFVLEHAILFEQVIRLKAALKSCQANP